ncbi:hypothetical protein [Geminisphaera colitermitum]|uniref:hypothetical protein n=1 Tax=Geminisphaera colitermitum TaxID=1148786 RepID=UPI000158D59F|nr:hypothetical protein [Geminisphaera colitermitum]
MHIGKHHTTKAIALCIGLLTLLSPLATNAAWGAGTILFEDTFAGTSGTSLAAHTPTTSLIPDAAWITRSWRGEPILANASPEHASAVRFQGNGAGFVSIASNGGYTKPENITLSASLSVGTLNFVGLGFWSTPTTGSTDSINDFVGIYINGSGEVHAMEKSAGVDVTIGGKISGFSTSSFYEVLLSVNTSTGALDRLTVNGVDYTAAFQTSSVTGSAFSGTATAYAGFLGRETSNPSAYGYVDDFTISTTSSIPEPQTAIYLIFVFLMITGMRLFRRK